MESARDQFATLRGTLVMWIVIGHMLLHERFAGIYDAGFARHEDFGALGALIALRFIGIDLFFMLSGLVLTLHYKDRFTQKTKGKEIDKFYLRRLKRIYPMHVAMMLVIVLFSLFAIPHPITSGNEEIIWGHWQWTGLINLLLMNGWGIIPVASWNEPSWSLSITFFIYVIFPNLLLILKRLPQRANILWALIIGLVLAYAAQRALIPFSSQSDGAGAVIRGVVFAAMGVTTGLLATSSSLAFWKKHGAIVTLGFIALIVLWTYLVQFPLTLLHLAYAPLLLALYAGGFRWLPDRLGQWMGSRSFALFMTHYPALLLIRFQLGDGLAGWASHGAAGKIAAYALTFGLCLLAAELAYRLFDRPFHQLRKR